MSKSRTAGGITSQVDPDTGDVVSIDHVHNQMHLGRSFVVTRVAALASGSTFQCIITPDGKEVHMAMLCSISGNGITVTLSEGAVFTGGTPIIPVNRNRESDKLATATFVHTPTVSNAGTPLISFHLDSGILSGARDRSTEELVLKSGTPYLLTVVVDSGLAAIFSGRMDWYEVDK